MCRPPSRGWLRSVLQALASAVSPTCRAVASIPRSSTPPTPRSIRSRAPSAGSSSPTAPSTAPAPTPSRPRPTWTRNAPASPRGTSPRPPPRSTTASIPACGSPTAGGNSGWNTGPTDPPITAPPPAPPGGGNLARGRTAADTGHSRGYLPGQVTDGDAGTYRESSDHAFPRSLTVALGGDRTVGRLVLKLPPAWGDRTQTLSVHGSADNCALSTPKASDGHAFARGAGAGAGAPCR
ncbi:galactose-binding domain-containing protein [Streptomyces sp. NPDC055254]